VAAPCALVTGGVRSTPNKCAQLCDVRLCCCVSLCLCACVQPLAASSPCPS
jgi:hypothetical protein